MKKALAFLFTVMFVVGCVGAGAVVVDAVTAAKNAHALQTLVGVDSLMGQACATGHGRVAPHVCAINALQSATTLSTTANACLAVDMTAGYAWPNSALGFGVLEINCSANCSSAAPLLFYSDNTCTGIFVQVWENAVPRYTLVRTVNGNVYYKKLTSGLGAGSTLRPVLYYD
jgi:hypothetical protein